MKTYPLDYCHGRCTMGGVFLRCTRRVKDGKEHRYWSIVENRRGASQCVVQRQVLYLGEINDSQRAAWCRCIEVFDEPGGQWHQVMLFPEDREAPELAQAAVHVRLHELKVLRPRRQGVLNSPNPMHDVEIPKGRPAGETYAYSLEEEALMLTLLPEPAAQSSLRRLLLGHAKEKSEDFMAKLRWFRDTG